MYRALGDRGQVELTTTPFFHPILPLVIDSDFARRARPDLPMPARFHAPDDADTQIRRAVEYHTLTFGRPPVGLWPSEGSVCPEMVPILHKAELRWFATDEGILARSFHLAGRYWNRQHDLYQPYTVGTEGQTMTMVFRDRELSDNFGFVYHKTTPDSAADDVLRRVRDIAMHIQGEQAIIPIILDGENPWEHYHDGGERFLSLLYHAFSGPGFQAGEGIRIATATFTSALEAVPPTQHLDRLHSGSWINQDFKIWIGHPEDNRGWDLLQHTRTRLPLSRRHFPPSEPRLRGKNCMRRKAVIGSGGTGTISTPITSRNSTDCFARTSAMPGPVRAWRHPTCSTSPSSRYGLSRRWIRCNCRSHFFLPWWTDRSRRFSSGAEPGPSIPIHH